MPKSLVKKLFLKIFLLFLPFILIFAYPLLVILMADEETSPDHVIVLQQQDPSLLYGPAFTNQIPYYKLQNTLIRKPQILILGTSRVMQFRQNFFSTPTNVYNAGGGIVYLWDYADFLKLIPSNQQPKLLILGLDQWQFNPNWRRERHQLYQTIKKKTHALVEQPLLHVLQANFKEIYQAMLAEKVTFDLLWKNIRQRQGIGLNAVIEKQGFRSDGSYRYGLLKLSDYQERYVDALDRIKNGANFFAYAENMDNSRLEILRKILEFCQQNNIHVVAFLPPFSPASMQAMLANQPRYNYLTQIAHTLEPVFQEYGFSFFDFTNPKKLKITSDDEFIDGFHGSEKTYLQILIQLAKRDEYLAKYVDLSFLENLLQTVKDPIYIFND